MSSSTRSGRWSSVKEILSIATEDQTYKSRDDPSQNFTAKIEAGCREIFSESLQDAFVNSIQSSR